jgi:uncharacterized protein (DUF885 family)
MNNKVKTSLMALGLGLGVFSVGFVVNTGASISASVFVQEENNEKTKLYKLFDDEVALQKAHQANGGEFDINNQFVDQSPAGHLARLNDQKLLLDRLNGIDPSTLSKEDQLNYNLFEFVMSHRVTQAEFKPYRIPFLADSGFFIRMASQVERKPFKTVEDYNNYLAWLDQLPAYVDQHIDNMKQGISDGFTMPRIILDGIKGTIDAYANANVDGSVYFAPFKSIPGNFSAEDQAAILEKGKAGVAGKALAASKKLADFFTNTYMPAARKTLGAKDLPGGSDYYKYLVTFFTTMDITPKEVHDLGLSEVKRIRGEMEAIIKRVGFKGSFKEFLTFLRTDKQFYATSKRDLLKEASYISKRIDAAMPRFFKTLPRKPYGVRAVPDEIAPNYTTGRYWGSRSETTPGYFMVNTYAVDKRPLYALPSLALHEGVPGHHHQNAISGELENMPTFRSRTRAHAFGEGWGLYTETLGEEMGIYETDYERFGKLTYEMWRAGRLVVDTGMHFFGWSRQDAVNLFLENSALNPHNINTEVDRYIAWPGQALAYKMGELTILRLRKKAEDALGDKFDIRTFHDAILAKGSMPMNLLEAQIDDFIADSLKAK